MFIESFKQMIVWQRAIEVVKEVYRISKDLPDTERFGLISQMRRAAVFIPSNIAEGKKRKTKKDYLVFLRIADGSAAELETLLIITKSLYPQINCTQCASLLEEVQKMLTTMIKKLGSSDN